MLAVLDNPLATAKVEALRREISKLPQYQPVTKHYFHGGMYCREVYRDAGVALVGAIHRKAHFYLIVYGTVILNGGEEVTGPSLQLSIPGTQRAVFSKTPVLCMTFHATHAKTVEEAEMELVEECPESMYGPGNVLKQGVLT